MSATVEQPSEAASPPFDWRDYVSTQNRLEQAISRCEADLQAADEDVRATGKALGHVEALAFAAGEALEAASAEAQAHQTALDRHARLTRALRSLREEQVERDDEIILALRSFEDEQDRYREAALAAFRAEVLTPAVTAWREVVRQALAIEDALNVQIPDLRETPIPDDWRASPAARTTFEAHAGMKALASEMERIRSSQARRRLAREKLARTRLPFLSAEGTRFTPRGQGLRFAGEWFPPDAVLEIGKELDPATAEKLFQAGRIARLAGGDA